ncbi:MAG: Hpt domain-containing protein [Vampirovibrionia bacterium]
MEDFPFSEEELEEVLNIFQEESEEQIQKLNDNLLKLESNPKDDKAIQEIFREAHSLKGAARMIGFDDIQTIAHRLEDIFGLARKGELAIRPEIIDIMCHAVDSIDSIIQDTVKTKGGTHSVNIQEIIDQLTRIEKGEIPVKSAEKKVEEEPVKDTGMLLKKDKPPKIELKLEDLQEYDELIPEKEELIQEIESVEESEAEEKFVPFIEMTKHEPEESDTESIIPPPQSPFEDVDDAYNITHEGFSEEELLELRQIFYAESIETTDFIKESIEKLKTSPYDREVLAEAYRNANSLEGSTRIINFVEIKDYTYSIRDIFEQASKEEIFINSELLKTLETYVSQVVAAIEERQKKDGCEDSLGLDQLQEQIDQKMENYKKQNIKPKKVKKNKISLSSDSLSFDEEEVLEEFGVKEKTIKPVQEKKEVPAEIKSKFDKDPLSLTDEELGDLQIGSLKGVKPQILHDQIPFEDEETITASWSISSVNIPKSKEKEGQTDFDSPLARQLKETSDDLHIFSNNVNNKNLLKKISLALLSAKELAVQEEKHVLLAILQKIETIFSDARSGIITFTTEMAIVIAQSIESAIILASGDSIDTDEVVDDPSLIYQRLMILHQTLKLTAGIPFEEEVEPDVFKTLDKNNKVEVVEPKTIIDEQQKVEKIKPVKESVDKSLNDNSSIDKPEKESSLVSKSFSSPFAFSSSVSPVGDMYQEKEKAAAGALETYTIKTLRVDTRKLDQLVAQVGELIVAKIKAKERLIDIERLLNYVEDWQREWSKSKTSFKSHEKKYLKAAFMPEGTSIYTPGKDSQAVVRENSDRLANLANYLNMLYRNIQEDDTRLSLIIAELEDKIKNVRLLPLATIFNIYPRTVRDMARQQNKQIELDIRGSETTVDKKIIEEIKSPLVHLLRNAIDHGFETPEERTRKGKNPTGRLVISASHLENSVLIEIMDDGRGIDIEAIKQKVIDKELLTSSELSVMSENQIMNIIFWPGFSTSKSVTELSGRGVGMDVVHTKITQLNGQVKIHSKLGEGCKVSIKLPVTMATIQVFLVKVLNQTYAIPATAINTAVLVKPEEIFYKEGKQTVLVGGVPVFLHDLASLLELNRPAQESTKKEKITVLVIQTEEANIGFIVDVLLGDQEILHKNLEPPLIRVRNVAGVTTLGSGEVCLILNVGDLIKASQMTQGMSLRTSFKKQSAMIEAHKDKKNDILVVDDSVTTRILERNILRAAGYNVTVAVNGLDALTKLSTQHVDLVVSDVEMPDISGYELTSRIKNDEMLKHLPVVLVTSLASELDRQKGLQSGASAYITKGGFNQEELLTTVKMLLT